LTYTYAARSAEELAALRAPLRSAHLALIAATPELALGGALGPSVSASGSRSTGELGGLLLFRSSDSSVAERFAKNDPYVTGAAGVASIVASWTVRPWTVVVER